MSNPTCSSPIKPFQDYPFASFLKILKLPANTPHHKFWNTPTLQSIYNDLHMHDPLFRTTSSVNVNFVRPFDIANILLFKPESDDRGSNSSTSSHGSPEDIFDLSKREGWEEDWHQAFAVKQMIDELGEEFPAFRKKGTCGKELYDYRKINVGVMILMMVFRICKGKRMEIEEENDGGAGMCGESMEV